MAKFRFQRGIRVVLHGRERLIEQKLPSGCWQLRDVANETFSAATEDELVNAFFAGDLEWLGEEVTAKYIQRKTANNLKADFSQLPTKDRAGARRRYAYVHAARAVEANTVREELLKPIIEAVSLETEDPKPPSCMALYRWRRDFAASGGDIRSLVPGDRNKGNKTDKVRQPEVSAIIDEEINTKYLHPQRLTVLAVYDAIELRIHSENEFRTAQQGLLKVPSPATVYNRIKKLDPYEVDKARFGPRFAEHKHLTVGAGPQVERPLERVEIDHTKLDLFVVDEDTRLPIGRPWLTLAIDHRSRAILGFYLSFNPPSYLSVMNCLRHAILPKTYLREQFPRVKHDWEMYGVPELAVVDNGKEFISTHLEDAGLQLGMTVQFAPVKLPWFKGTVERYFGTLNRKLLHRKPGTSFSNIFEKKDYDSVKHAVISAQAFLEIIHIWIVDVYLRSKHKGLRDIPARVWAAGTADFKPALPSRPGDLNILLGQITTRTITRSGIEWEGLRYQDDKLSLVRRRLGEQPATVKYDPNDLGMLWVLDPLTSEFVPVPALDQTYAAGLTLWQHRVIRRFARETVDGAVDIVALLLAKSTIQKIVEEEYRRSKRTGTAQKMGRWLDAGSGRIKQLPVGEPPLTGSAPSPDADPGSTLIEVETWAGVADLGAPEEVPSTSSTEATRIATPEPPAVGVIVNAGKTPVKSRPKGARRPDKIGTNRPAAGKSSPPGDHPAPPPATLGEDDGSDLDTSGFEGGYYGS